MLVTAGLGWVTAVAVGLTGPSGEPVVDALPSVAQQAEPSGPTFGRTLDLDAVHADRASRSSASTSSAGTPTSSSASSTSAAVSTSEPATGPAPEPSSTPTRDTVPVVRQGDPCRSVGAVAVTKSGAAAVCTTGRGNGGQRWRHA